MAVHFDPIEIAEAYYAKMTVKKDSPRYKLAEERLKICNECEYNTKAKVGNVYYCAKCGCVIGGKVFSRNDNPCPLKKWSNCDTPYFTQSKKEHLL